MIAAVRQRLSLLSPAERARWVAVVCLALATAALEATSGVVIYALVAVLSGPSGPVPSHPLLARVSALLAASGLHAEMMTLAVVLAVLQVSKTLLRILVAYCRGWVHATGCRSLATRLFKAYLAAPYAFHVRRGTTVLVQNVLGAVGSLFGIFDDVLALLMEALVVAGLVLLMGWVTPAETIVTALLVAGVLALFLKLTRRTYSLWGAERWRLDTAILRNLQQSLAGIKEVKVLGREGHFARAFDRDQASVGRLQLLQIAIGGIPRVVTETVFLCGAAGVLLLGRWRGHTGAEMLPLLGLYAYAGFRALPAAQRVAHEVTSIRWHLGRTESLCRDMAVVLGDAGRAPVSSPDGAFAFRERIVVEHVSFAYEGAARPVLADVTLTIGRGESVGLVGATGAGKTTLADLILGLLEPGAGRITVDGVPIERNLRAWQDRIGYVPQSPFLIDDSLRRNIAFGLADAEIDEGQVASAVEIAQLSGLVASLPGGLDTSVGERGVRLSGGERQRVAIARALYHEPELLVFDEATSSLDPATERALTFALEALRGRKTILVIAHRLSTVRGCDLLVMLRGGRIEAIGGYEDLVATSPAFRALSALPEPAAPAAPAAPVA